MAIIKCYKKVSSSSSVLNLQCQILLTHISIFHS